MTAVMAGVNLVVDPAYFKLPLAAVKTMVATAIIPFNLLRGVINGVATVGILFALRRTSFFRTNA
jgi:riboflavin transporter FmnP